MAIFFVDPSGGNDGNDGFDVQGLALVNATYDHTGNPEGERHLASSGAFSGYTFVSGDEIYLLNAAGGIVVPALYEIASKVDSDAILLVADAGLTADSTADVDSSSGAFLTTQKAADTAVGGDEVRLCATATETPAATVDWDTNAGAETTPIEFKGASANGVVGTLYTLSGSSLPASTTLAELAVADFAIRFTDIRFTAGKTHCFDVTSASNGFDLVCRGCRFDNAAADGLRQSETLSSSRHQFWNCEFDNNGVVGANFGNATNVTGPSVFAGNSVHDNAAEGVKTARRSGGELYLNNLVYDNVGDGFKQLTTASTGYLYFIGNTVFANDGDGLDLVATSSMLSVYNNIIFCNGGFGINTNTGNINRFAFLDYNCSADNTSGDIDINSDVLSGDNNVLSDPLFVSETDGSEDLGLQASSPCIGAGFPGVMLAGGTGFMDIGALQREMASGGTAKALAY